MLRNGRVIEKRVSYRISGCMIYTVSKIVSIIRPLNYSEFGESKRSTTRKWVIPCWTCLIVRSCVKKSRLRGAVIRKSNKSLAFPNYQQCRSRSILTHDLPVSLYRGQPYCVKPFFESRANAAQAHWTYLIVASCATELERPELSWAVPKTVFKSTPW